MKTAMRFKKKKQSNYAFIDSQNLNLGVQKAGWKMDWRKFRTYLQQAHNVTHAYMFIGYMAENESLYEQMHEAGYIVVLKPTVEITTSQAHESRSDLDGMQGEAEKRNKPYKKYGARVSQSSTPQATKSNGGIGDSADEHDTAIRSTKGNVDADLVLHCMKELPNYKKAIIVSGDGDFFGLVEYLDAKGKLLHILTPNWQYSSLLKPFDRYIVRIDQLRKELSYRDFRRRKR